MPPRGRSIKESDGHILKPSQLPFDFIAGAVLGPWFERKGHRGQCQWEGCREFGGHVLQCTTVTL